MASNHTDRTDPIDPIDRDDRIRRARTVRAEQCHRGALADPERHVVEQHPPVRQLVAHSGDVHVSHGRQCPRPAPPTRAD